MHEGGQNISIDRSLEQLSSDPYMTLNNRPVKEVTAYLIEIARELEFQVGPQDIPELQQS